MLSLKNVLLLSEILSSKMSLRILFRFPAKTKRKAPNQAIRCFSLAESQGFEPWVRDYRTHDFQSCAFDHSANSPYIYNSSCEAVFCLSLSDDIYYTAQGIQSQVFFYIFLFFHFPPQPASSAATNSIGTRSSAPVSANAKQARTAPRYRLSAYQKPPRPPC